MNNCRKKPIVPVKYHGPINIGKSQPQLIEFSDGNKYLVKFKNNFRGTRKIVNEYVAGRLAQQLSLPVVPFKVVHVPATFLLNHGLHRYGFEGGNQFASLFLPKCSTLLTLEPKSVQNKNKLPGIIVFDHWLSNADRSKRNLLLQKLPNGKIVVYIIDHEKCFPGWGDWTEKSLRSKPPTLNIKSVHIWCAKFTSKQKDLQPYMDKILNLQNRKVTEIVDSIPPDWHVTAREKTALIRYIMNSKRRVPQLVKQFILHAEKQGTIGNCPS